MIDDRICIFYVADRVQDIANGDTTAEEFLNELTFNIGVNARLKYNQIDQLADELPPIKSKRGRPRK